MTLSINVGQIIVWLIIGALAGSLAGMLVTRRKEGFGVVTNLGIGLAGALIGGLIFWVFKIDLGLGQFSVSFEDLIAAFVGSLIFLGLVWLIQKRRRAARKPKQETGESQGA